MEIITYIIENVMNVGQSVAKRLGYINTAISFVGSLKFFYKVSTNVEEYRFDKS